MLELPTNDQISSFVDQLRPAVEQVAKSLGVAATELYRIGIMKQYVDGFSMLALFPLTILLGFITKLIWTKISKPMMKNCSDNHNKYCDCEIPAYVVVIISTVITIGFFIASIAVFRLALLHLIVPEWTLLQEVLTYIN